MARPAGDLRFPNFKFQMISDFKTQNSNPARGPRARAGWKPARRALCSLIVALPLFARAADADFILHNAKVVTVDPQFSIQEAIAVGGDRILPAGRDAAVLEHRGPRTEVIDLQ